MVLCMELVRRDHDVELTESGLWSHVLNWCEETMMYIEWSMVSCMELA